MVEAVGDSLQDLLEFDEIEDQVVGLEIVLDLGGNLVVVSVQSLTDIVPEDNEMGGTEAEIEAILNDDEPFPGIAAEAETETTEPEAEEKPRFSWLTGA